MKHPICLVFQNFPFSDLCYTSNVQFHEQHAAVEGKTAQVCRETDAVMGMAPGKVTTTSGHNILLTEQSPDCVAARLSDHTRHFLLARLVLCLPDIMFTCNVIRNLCYRINVHIFSLFWFRVINE